MKIKAYIVIPIFILVGGAIWLSTSRERPSQSSNNLKKEYTEEGTILKQSISRLPLIESLETPEVKANNPKTIPEDMKGATKDPAVIEFLKTYRKIEVGKIVTTTNDTQELRSESKLLFEGKRIGSRSISDSGIIALDAVTGDKTPIEDTELFGTSEEMKNSSLREIWLIDSTGHKAKVSPPNIDAFAPVISPNGKMIAFTGRNIDEKGFPSAERLFVGDPKSAEYRMFSGDENFDNYRIWAVDWVENGTILRVLQDYGETGGHMELRQIHFE